MSSVNTATSWGQIKERDKQSLNASLVSLNSFNTAEFLKRWTNSFNLTRFTRRDLHKNCRFVMKSSKTSKKLEFRQLSTTGKIVVRPVLQMTKLHLWCICIQRFAWVTVWLEKSSHLVIAQLGRKTNSAKNANILTILHFANIWIQSYF